MADPLSITAAIIGIATPAAHGVRLLLDDIQRIKDAPANIKALGSELDALNSVVKSLQSLELEPLGGTIAAQAQDAERLCGESCAKFQQDLRRWTRHGDGETLAWRDQLKIGFFKQRQIQTMSTLLQRCKGTLSLVLATATLFASLNGGHVDSSTVGAAANPEADIASAIEETNQQLQDAVGQYRALARVRNDANDDAQDRSSAVDQVVDEEEFLDISQTLLKALLAKAQKVAASGQTGGDRVSVQVQTANQSIRGTA
ncbi:hypothetical protein GQ53DRAFT_854000 [Thozetella sp. PMI_491]|nr:hypothetical protein GQ53DRAFT_854000 [Thozetella sp. PMI_491]